ncbi:hypothetical protein F4805DRAFT_453654 [Annulohypoxylon moriforme]|nr:hypothetical protein F4805DRAFT_453654 [Annulohypoxylon moriforme]
MSLPIVTSDVNSRAIPVVNYCSIGTRSAILLRLLRRMGQMVVMEESIPEPVNRHAHPFIVTDLSQPYLVALRYGNQLPTRRIKREIGFDDWMEKWKEEFTNLGFNFRNRRHVFDIAYAFNLAEVSRIAIGEEGPIDIADLYLGSEELEIGLRMAVAETDAWVPTGDLLTAGNPTSYAPRQMFSKDRDGVAKNRYIVFPVHGGLFNHWSLLIYDGSARKAMT